MKIYLWYYHPDQGPLLFETSVKNSIDETHKDKLASNLAQFQKEEFFEELVEIADQKYINLAFQITSDWNPQGFECVMFSVMGDNTADIPLYNELLQIMMDWLTEDSELYKAFYNFADRNDSEIVEKKKLVSKILHDFDTILVKNMDKFRAIFAQIIFLGIQAVGKTSLVNYLANGSFTENVRPTLAPHVLKIIFERINFRVFDVGGQKKLRQSWQNVCKQPQAILFICDISHSNDLQQEAIVEFDRMMKFYFQEKEGLLLDKSTPVLILGNKIDLNTNYTIAQLKQQYQPQQYEINYRCGLCSALNGNGILSNMKWLVRELQKNLLLK